MKVRKENLVPFGIRLFVFKGFSHKWELKIKVHTYTHNNNNNNNNNKTFLCKMRNHISRALLVTKFNCTETDRILLFYLKLILAKS